jgi:hypothetical protein
MAVKISAKTAAQRPRIAFRTSNVANRIFTALQGVKNLIYIIM